MTKKKDFTWLYIAGFAVVVFIIAILVFLFSKDEYNGQEVTGLTVIKSYGAGFWLWALVGTIAAGVFGYVSYANATGSGSLGRKLPGKEWTTILLIIIALLCLTGPWIRACNDKANGGWTLPKTETKAL